MTINRLKIAGIDYGSKLAGTTVIAFINAQNVIEFAASDKNKDADKFIIEWTKYNSPNIIFIDAPLSLPGVYQHLPDYNDYFYRVADKAVQAMSPMFLGGLTARAMKLRTKLQTLEIEVQEVYPGYLAKILTLDKTLYKKQMPHLPTLLALLSDSIPYPIPAVLPSWHHFDALLALLSGIRYLQNEHLVFGNPIEGLIIV